MDWGTVSQWITALIAFAAGAIAITGCQWRAIPKDLPPRSTLFDYLDLWSYDEGHY